MTATNSAGFEIQVYDRRIGWITEHDGFESPERAKAVLDALPSDGHERRVYESLKGFP